MLPSYYLLDETNGDKLNNRSQCNPFLRNFKATTAVEPPARQPFSQAKGRSLE